MPGYTLGASTLRALQRNDQSRRTSPIYAQAPRSYIDAPNMRTSRMESGLAVVVQPGGIPAAVQAPFRCGRGGVQFLLLQDDGSLLGGAPVVNAYNPGLSPVLQGEVVEIFRDWKTGRWFIIAKAQNGMVHFTLEETMSAADEQAAAIVVDSWGGAPHSATDSIVVYNLDAKAGGYVFSGDVEAHGIASYDPKLGLDFYRIINMECPVPEA